ncbi:MAG: uracil-DNA glycosylase family protein [Planctomycetota bacterium]
MSTPRIVQIAKRLATAVDELQFGAPVTHVYNPLDYAWAAHAQYLRRYARGRKEFVLLGMNPGPFGMAQTGVPFGEVAAVRDWLDIHARIAKPAREHPKRPVEGFACRRSEVSGQRLWGWAAGRFGEPERFFARFVVLNYCPLVFMADTGRNITPDKLAADERRRLGALCDAALRDAVACLRPRLVIGVGAFAEARAREVLPGSVAIGRILHPSPASPLANRGWAEAAEAELAELGVALP